MYNPAVLYWHELFCSTYAQIDAGFLLNFSWTDHGTGPCLTTDGMNSSSLEEVLLLALITFL